MIHDKLWRALAGVDRAKRPGLPYDEALAPMPALALILLVVNDRVLKVHVPSAITGKLSDFAGLAVAPLVLTAACDVVLWLVSRAPVSLRPWRSSDEHQGVKVDWTLRRWKLVASIVATGVVFAAVKLYAPASHALADLLASVFGQARIVTDPTDLFALPALALAWWHGRRTLAHIPYGRVQWAQRTKATAPFADAVAAGADPAKVAALDAAVTTWIAGGSHEPVDAALAALRSP